MGIRTDSRQRRRPRPPRRRGPTHPPLSPPGGVTPGVSAGFPAPPAAHAPGKGGAPPPRLYRRVMNPLLHHTAARYGFLALVALLLLGSMALVGTGFVKMKMLPFDNK